MSEHEDHDPIAVESGEWWGSTMLYVGGSKRSHRCDRCGANVYQKHRTEKQYRCNGCGDVISEDVG